MIPEWLNPVWALFNSALQQRRLPHAVLITGPIGVGKHDLARQMAAVLLCQTPLASGAPCHACNGCRQIDAGRHPDYLRVEPEETGKAIKIDQIRDFTAHLAMTSHSGGYKTAIIAPADAMNINASNSLLKTLEEPTDNTYIILVTSVPGRLPVTIRSRCQLYRCSLPEPETASTWLKEQIGSDAEIETLLKLANGAPYEAKKLYESGALDKWKLFAEQLVGVANGRLHPLSVAESWKQENGVEKLGWFWTYLQMQIRSIQIDTGPETSELTGRMRPLMESVDTRTLYDCMDRVSNSINQWSSGLNTQLMLDDLLINWARLFADKQARR